MKRIEESPSDTWSELASTVAAAVQPLAGLRNYNEETKRDPPEIARDTHRRPDRRTDSPSPVLQLTYRPLSAEWISMHALVSSLSLSCMERSVAGTEAQTPRSCDCGSRNAAPACFQSRVFSGIGRTCALTHNACGLTVRSRICQPQNPKVHVASLRACYFRASQFFGVFYESAKNARHWYTLFPLSSNISVSSSTLSCPGVTCFPRYHRRRRSTHAKLYFPPLDTHGCGFEARGERVAALALHCLVERPKAGSTQDIAASGRGWQLANNLLPVNVARAVRAG